MDGAQLPERLPILSGSLKQARTTQVQAVTEPAITCVTEHHTNNTTQKAQGTAVDKGTGLRAPSEFEEVNEVLGGHGREAAVGVSRGAGVSRVLPEEDAAVATEV